MAHTGDYGQGNEVEEGRDASQWEEVRQSEGQLVPPPGGGRPMFASGGLLPSTRNALAPAEHGYMLGEQASELLTGHTSHQNDFLQYVLHHEAPVQVIHRGL